MDTFINDTVDSTVLLISSATLLLLLLVKVLYILTLQKTLQAISAENRAMRPGRVWLLLIPVFNYIWSFIVVNALSLSIKNEAYDKEFRLGEAEPARKIGTTMALMAMISVIPLFGAVTKVAYIICWIGYWYKINKYKHAIIEAPLKTAEENSIFYKL